MRNCASDAKGAALLFAQDPPLGVTVAGFLTSPSTLGAHLTRKAETVAIERPSSSITSDRPPENEPNRSGKPTNSAPTGAPSDRYMLTDQTANYGA